MPSQKRRLISVIKCLIFDLDGTLVDTGSDLTNSLNYSLEPYGYEKMTVQEAVSLVGEGLSRLVEKAVGDRKEIIPAVTERFIRYYSEHLTDNSEPYPGVSETLEKLGGYKKAVISNKREFLSKKLLEELSLLSYFDLVLGSDSVDEKKPSPKPIFRVLETFSVEKGEAVIIGDSVYDIEAGKAAGVKTVAVTYGFMRGEALAAADFIIHRMDELPAVLGVFHR